MRGSLPGMKTTIEIFRAGRHTPMSGAPIDFSDADIAEIAASYDPTRHEAPLVVGHPATDAPAYGWIAGLTAESGHLFAELAQVDPEFAELVRHGRYKKISASLYGRQSPQNPTPGRYHLKHVGFLGAVPPSVKGLRQISFAEGTESLDFGDSDPAALTSPEGAGDRTGEATASVQADALAQSAGVAEAPVASPAVVPEVADIEARLAQIAEREAALAAREKALAEAEAAHRAADNAAFAESLARQGRLLPRDRAGVVALLGVLPEAELSFAEGDTTMRQTPAALLRDLLSRAPVQVEFAELAPTAACDAPTSPQAIHDAAVAFCEAERQAGRAITLEDAVYRVTGGAR